MPLVVTLKPGEDFFVGDESYVLDAIRSTARVALRRSSDGKAFEVVDDKMVEIESNVMVAVGTRTTASVARITVEAPRSILVLKGDKYRLNPPAKTA